MAKTAYKLLVCAPDGVFVEIFGLETQCLKVLVHVCRSYGHHWGIGGDSVNGGGQRIKGHKMWGKRDSAGKGKGASTDPARLYGMK